MAAALQAAPHASRCSSSEPEAEAEAEEALVCEVRPMLIRSDWLWE